MKNFLTLVLVLALLAIPAAQALAQAAPVSIQSIEIQSTTAPGTSPGVDLSPQPDPPSAAAPKGIGSSGNDTVETGIGGVMRQNNESNYDFVLRAISSEGSTARAVFVKLGDIKGESTDSGDAGSETTVKGVVVRGWDAETKEAVLAAAPKSPADVRTSENLALFAAKLVVETGDTVPVENVSFNFQKITWEYKQSGRLFGFIPLGLLTALEVSEDPDSLGRVKVKLPWYRVLFGKTLSSSELEVLWDAQLTPGAFENSNQKQAQTLQTMSNVSKAIKDQGASSIQVIR